MDENSIRSWLQHPVRSFVYNFIYLSFHPDLMCSVGMYYLYQMGRVINFQINIFQSKSMDGQIVNQSLATPRETARNNWNRVALSCFDVFDVMFSIIQGNWKQR